MPYISLFQRTKEHARLR